MRSVACRSETGPASPSRSSKASRPLPSPLSFTGVSRSYRRRDAVPRKDLARQSDVRLRAFALHRDHHRIGCHQTVQSEYVQGRRTVEQDELVLPGDRLEGAFQAGLAVLKLNQFYLGAGKVAVGRNQIVPT